MAAAAAVAGPGGSRVDVAASPLLQAGDGWVERTAEGGGGGACAAGEARAFWSSALSGGSL